MWSLIKKVVFLSIIACIVLYFTGYKVKGKTIQEHAAPYLQQKMVKEAIRDLRSIVGEGLKSAGQAVSEDVTDDEKKQLDDVLKKELQMGKTVEQRAEQKSLPPVTKPATPPAVPAVPAAPAVTATQGGGY